MHCSLTLSVLGKPDRTALPLELHHSHFGVDIFYGASVLTSHNTYGASILTSRIAAFCGPKRRNFALHLNLTSYARM
jgi:hypothetical protein